MVGPLKILILSPYPPYPPYGGGTMRIYQLLRGLATHHEVTCLTFAPSAEAERLLAPLRNICQVLTVPGPDKRSIQQRFWTTFTSPLPDMALRNASATYVTALTKLLEIQDFDIVQVESIEMAGYLHIVSHPPGAKLGAAEPCSARPRRRYPTTILDQFNAEFMLQRRACLTDIHSVRRWHAALYSLIQWLKLVRYEREKMRLCDVVVAVSKADQAILQQLAPMTQIGIVPNGVDTTHFSRAALFDEQIGTLTFRAPVIVFSGTLDFRPNVDALIWFAREVLPHVRKVHRHVQVLVIGKHPVPALLRLASTHAIQIIGTVPDTRPYIAGAMVYIVPMRIGGGVRLKLLEALSMEAPVVSTTMGAEGIAELQTGTHCLLADTPIDFANAVLRLLNDTAFGQQLGATGRKLVREHYDWSVIIPRLDSIYAGAV